MSKWNETKLDQELENLINEFPEQDDFDKRIEHYINRKIRKIVHKTLITVLAVVLVFAAIINPILNFVCLNPKKEVYLDVLRDYYETTRPFSEIISIDAKSRGFGCYKLEITASNHYEPLVFGRVNVTAKMAFGKLYDINDSNMYIANIMGRFQEESWAVENKDSTIEYISKLPESSKLYMAIHSQEPQELEILRNSGVEIEWMEIHQPNVAFQGGLSMNLHAMHKEDGYRDNMSERELLDVYISNLENLTSNTLIWSQLGLPSATIEYTDISLVKNTLEDAKKLDQILTENYCIYGERDAIINYLENTDISTIFIEKITLY